MKGHTSVSRHNAIMVLVTGTGGQTGQAVIKALAKKDIEVSALVHRENQSEQIMAIGAKKWLWEIC
ncbi:MAG: SDR family oxidoreductase [Clostridiales bacterium]|nr:SDR family oxidoreductase [Clostridiales bacterium]